MPSASRAQDPGISAFSMWNNLTDLVGVGYNNDLIKGLARNPVNIFAIAE